MPKSGRELLLVIIIMYYFRYNSNCCQQQMLLLLLFVYEVFALFNYLLLCFFVVAVSVRCFPLTTLTFRI